MRLDCHLFLGCQPKRMPESRQTKRVQKTDRLVAEVGAVRDLAAARVLQPPELLADSLLNELPEYPTRKRNIKQRMTKVNSIGKKKRGKK